jgi:hypothetical protein
VQVSSKHASGVECLKRLRRGCRRATKLHSNGSKSDEKSPQTRTPDRRTMTVGLASKTPGRNRPEIGGKGGVVLQANCKQWIQERPGSVRNAAEASNANSQVKAHFLPLGSVLRHSKYHPKWLFKSPLRHQIFISSGQGLARERCLVDQPASGFVLAAETRFGMSADLCANVVETDSLHYFAYRMSPTPPSLRRT